MFPRVVPSRGRWSPRETAENKGKAGAQQKRRARVSFTGHPCRAPAQKKGKIQTGSQRTSPRKKCEEASAQDKEFDLWMLYGDAPADGPTKVSKIHAASARFKRSTCAVDGWHPQHFKNLRDGSLTRLGLIFWMAECVGQFTEESRDVRIALITNRRRPVGLCKKSTAVVLESASAFGLRVGGRARHATFLQHRP